MIEHEINGMHYDEERALYNLQDTRVKNCVFAGPADGESALKEAGNIAVEGCSLSLRYPLWHVKQFTIADTVMDENARAALWYSNDGVITNSKLNGIKAVRECDRITIRNCEINSPEFGWKSRNVIVEDTTVNAEYLFFDSRDITLSHVKMSGKYSFQYIGNMTIEDSELDTKDAFWHSKNVTVKNSIVKGEYLGWYSDGLTLINCKIIGTQPLCYCKNLRLENCTMEQADFAFEYSDVNADISGSVISIKNPKSGTITVDHVDEIIREDAVMDCTEQVRVREVQRV
jgi:hypothetical protein